MRDKIRELLCSLGICDNDSIAPFYPKVRDRNDVSVLRCKKSGVMLLSRSDHMGIYHYHQQDGLKYWGGQDRKAALTITAEDDQRRARQFEGMIRGRKWMDIGSGAGGILDYLSPIAGETIAVEPQNDVRKCLVDIGYVVYPLIEDVKQNGIEVVTLFHVLEHFTDPIQSLGMIKSRMIKGGRIIVEVPHANDFLLSTLNSEAFKAFTFWSEHLILHTRQSLKVFLEAAGFVNVEIQGFQRYPLANHLHWLAQGKPGGHVSWKHLRTQALDRAYEDFLKSIDQTDTLIAIAEV